MTTDRDVLKALDELRDIANEANELANAFLLTGNINIHFKLSRFTFRIRDRCDVVLDYLVGKT